MLKTVVVPLDGSPLSEQALPFAKRVIAPGSKIILTSVIEVPTDFDYVTLDLPSTYPIVRRFTQEELDATITRVEDYLEAFARRLKRDGYQVECVAHSGDPAKEITSIATARSADAIVMTTHGRTGLNRFLFGSVTQKVMAQMTCPILVVPGTVSEKAQVPIQNERQIPLTT